MTESGAQAPARSSSVLSHEPHSGTYRTRLESNGRIVLPSALRGPFVAEGACHLLARQGRCLLLYTPSAFDHFVDVVTKNSSVIDGESRVVAAVEIEPRAMLYRAAPRVSVDKQARLVIPQEQRERVGFQVEAEMVLAGAIERVELWQASSYDEIDQRDQASIDLLLNGFNGLPTRET